MIHVGQLSPGKQWDQNMLDLLFANELYPTGLEFKRVEGYPNTYGCVLLIPGRYWVGHEAEIGEALGTYDWVLAIRTGDEEDLFRPELVKHRNLKWWVQTPRTNHDYGDARLFGVGFPPHFNNLELCKKTVDFFLSAQNNHPRRQEAFDATEMVEFPKVVQATFAFTKGLRPNVYADTMGATKVALAPSGPRTPDTFRLYEALEAHAIPIADDITPGYDSRGYWRMLFPDAPFLILADYVSLNGYVGDALHDWPTTGNQIAAWWLRQKRAMAQWLVDDLTALGAL
jgi:hypothetical protein